MRDFLEQLGIELPSNSNLTSLGKKLFDPEFFDKGGSVITAKLLLECFKTPMSDEGIQFLAQIFSQFPSVTFGGSKIEFRSIDAGKERMIYTDELEVFLFIVKNLRHVIHTVNAPVDGILVHEWNYLKQLELFENVKDIGFFRRGSYEVDSEADLLTEEQVQLYSDLINRSIKEKTLKVLRHPEMCFRRCIDELAKYKLDELHVEFEEADFLMEMDEVTLEVDRLVFRANYFKPSKLFSKFKMETLDLSIRFKYVKPKEESITPCISLKAFTCKVNYTTNLEEIFDYLNDSFPSLEKTDIEATWGISALTSYETYQADEKLKNTLNDCIRMINKVESAGLRAKSKGMKTSIKLWVKLFMPSEDTTFFPNKSMAKEFRKIIHDVTDSQFSLKAEDEDASPRPLLQPNGVTRFQKMVEYYMVLESVL